MIESPRSDVGTYESLLALDESIKKRGISERTMKRLRPRRPVSSEIGVECEICKENYKVNSSIIALPCKHLYHEDCILKWLASERTCPHCRFVLEN